jgi:hypothetical protein
VIDEHFAELEAVTSTSRACVLLSASRATRYRRRQPRVAGPSAPRPTPPNALSEAERQHVLGVLRSEECCDLAPVQVWARLLDDGIYLCSISTMYRLLAIAGENRERRRQRTHPAKKRPELCATGPSDSFWVWPAQERLRAQPVACYQGVMPKNLTVRLDDELAADTEALARAEGQSLNETVKTALREAVERRRDDPEFKQRVRRIIEEDTELLERLAK